MAKKENEFGVIETVPDGLDCCDLCVFDKETNHPACDNAKSCFLMLKDDEYYSEIKEATNE